MALIHPRNLELWHEWQRSRFRARSAAVGERLRSLRPGGASGQPPQYLLHSRKGEGEDRLLIAIDSDSAAARAALMTALPYLHAGVDVLAPADLDLPELAGSAWQRSRTTAPTELLDAGATRCVITLGGDRPAGALAHDWALGADIPAAVVQHRPLTPYAPPLPPHSTLLAWTEADGQFHRSGREDVEVRAVGSQLLWQLAHEGRADGDGRDRQEVTAELITSQRPVFLDQEETPGLPRRLSVRAARSFCRSESAVLRPRGSRRDALTRGLHTVLRRRGVEFEDPQTPLFDPPRPVVGILDPQLLEAAARGVPTWVYGRGMPSWVHEYWQRYGLRHWGGPPSPVPVPSADEPSRLIAQIVDGHE